MARHFELRARHGRGTAWARHDMFESALMVSQKYDDCPLLGRDVQSGIVQFMVSGR